MTDHAPDQELLARLRAADPASTLPPTEPDRVADLLEAAMSDTATRPQESRTTGTHDRSPLTWLVAAAAVVVLAGAGIFGLVSHRDHDSSPSVAGTVTRLGYAGQAGRCVLPNADLLGRQPVAFRGTLTSLVDGTATFDVTHWYAGGSTDLAKVATPPARLTELVKVASLHVGDTYLVAASDGNVTACGFSGPATGQLQRLYDRAFG